MALAVKLDDDGDLDFRGGGPRLVGGVEAARGALLYRFNTQAGTSRDDPGEWKYDYEYGVLWRQRVLGRYLQTDETQSHLALVASLTTGVAPTAAYQVLLTFDPNTRQQSISIDRLRISTAQAGSTLNAPVSIPVF